MRFSRPERCFTHWPVSINSCVPNPAFRYLSSAERKKTWTLSSITANVIAATTRTIDVSAKGGTPGRTIAKVSHAAMISDIVKRSWRLSKSIWYRLWTALATTGSASVPLKFTIWKPRNHFGISKLSNWNLGWLLLQCSKSITALAWLPKRSSIVGASMPAIDASTTRGRIWTAVPVKKAMVQHFDSKMQQHQRQRQNIKATYLLVKGIILPSFRNPKRSICINKK